MTARQFLDAASVERFEAAVGADDGSPVRHWAYFHDVVRDAALGDDGHLQRGDFLPVIEGLPRRMFASSAIDFHAALAIGEEAEMTLCITDIRHRLGGSGDLVFVDVQRSISQAGDLRLTERQTLVYRPSPSASPLPVPLAPADGWDGERWLPTTVNLFRFSAATFNGHRIHYDRSYATQIEGYADLVVQGPFIASRLAALAARRGPLTSFEFRALAPCFVDRPIMLLEVEECHVQAVRDDGVISMAAKVTYR